MDEAIEINHGGLRIVVEDGRNGVEHDAMSDAVVALIEMTDIDAIVQQGDHDAPHRFYDKTLASLARHYAADWPEPEQFTLRQVLEAMIEECSQRPYTQLNQPFEIAE
jgi:hypothetical protein